MPSNPDDSKLKKKNKNSILKINFYMRLNLKNDGLKLKKPKKKIIIILKTKLNAK